MLLAKVWYFLSTGGQAFVLPYFNVYFDQLGFSKDAIGVLSALRPWLSAPCAVLLCALADRLSCHTSLLVVTFAASLLLRCLLLLVPPHFLTVAALVLLSDCIGAPVGAIVDATVVGACKSDGDYGKHRMWASAAWGGLSVVAGSLVAQRGLGTGFFMYLLMSMPCIFIAFRLRKSAEAEKAAAAAAAAATAAQACSASPLDMQQKLAQQPMDASRTQPAAAAAAAEPAGELTEDLMARRLPGTPDSLSSYGGSSCATSSCGGSRPCSPDLGMPARCASPFSRFAATSFGRSLRIREADSGAGPEAAEYGVGRLQEGGLCSPGVHGVKQAGVAAAAGGDAMIKAWYAEEEPAEAQQQQQQQKKKEPAAVSPAAAAAELLAGSNFPQQPAGQQDEADAAAVAGAGANEIGTAAVLVSTAATAETKQSAKLELGTSQQLQSSYSLVEWQNDKAGAKAAATPAAAPASAHAADEDEGAPLLAADGKQPLPLKAAATQEAAAGAADATASAKGDAAGDDVTIRALLASPAVLVFMWRALIIGLGLGTIGNFLFLHVEELGATTSLMGLMLFFNCVTEVPAFHFQSVILERLPVPLVFNGSMLLLALRLAGYGFLPLLHSPWPVLALELLHGCTFASSWGAGIVHCKRLAPPHLNASMQGLFSSLYGGVGSGLGALLGGVLMQQLGGQALFFICSLVVLVGWLVGYLVELLLVQRGRQVQA